MLLFEQGLWLTWVQLHLPAPRSRRQSLLWCLWASFSAAHSQVFLHLLSSFAQDCVLV